MSKSKHELPVDLSTQISEAWTVKQLGSGEKRNDTECRKKPEKSKFHDNEDYSCQKFALWLNDFRSLYMRFCIKSLNDPASSEAKTAHGLSVQQNESFRRIPLGILVGFPDCLSKEECELLLHYAATGKMNQLGETRGTGRKHGKLKVRRQEDSVTWPVEFSQTEAMAGACIVFSLTDIVESMSDKSEGRKYLIKCIERQIQLNVDKDSYFYGSLKKTDALEASRTRNSSG